MNYLPWVGNAVYGATNAVERANYFTSWGIMASLLEAVEDGIRLKFKQLITHIPRLFKPTTIHIN